MLGIKWSLVRDKRIELEKRHKQVLDKFTFAKTWLHMMLKHVIAKRFSDVCRSRILENIRKIKFVFLINMAKFRFRRYFIHFRPTVFLRNR